MYLESINVFYFFLSTNSTVAPLHQHEAFQEAAHGSSEFGAEPPGFIAMVLIYYPDFVEIFSSLMQAS